MNRISVVSSNLVSVGYEPTNKILEIEFKGGSVYQYHSVPYEIYEGLTSASSHGEYFHEYIKDKYPFSKL